MTATAPTSPTLTRDAAAGRRERGGVALVVLSAVGFAAMVVMAKLAYAAGVNVTTLLTVRFAISAALLWALAARRGIARGGTPRDAGLALALGAVVYAPEVGLMFASLARIDASLAELLVFAYPALVVLAAIALRWERASRRRLGTLALAMAGVVLVLAGGGGAGGGDPLGIGLALGSAVLFALYVLLAARIGWRMPALTLAAHVTAGSAVSLAAFGLASGELQLAMGAEAWGWSIAIALFGGVVAMTAFLAGVERLGPGRASILALLEPPIACLLAFLAFDERLAPLQLAGGALVVLAALLLQVRPVRSLRRGASALPAPHTAARALARRASRRGGVGVRAEVGRLPRARVRGRRRGETDRPVARR